MTTTNTTIALSPAELDSQRALFEAWHCNKFATKHTTGQPTRDMHNGVYAEKYGPERQQQMWEAWQGALIAQAGAAQPAAVGAELPPLLKFGVGLTHDYVAGYNQAVADVRAAQQQQAGAAAQAMGSAKWYSCPRCGTAHFDGWQERCMRCSKPMPGPPATPQDQGATGMQGAADVKRWHERMDPMGGFIQGQTAYIGHAAVIAARDAEIADLRAQLARYEQNLAAATKEAWSRMTAQHRAEEQLARQGQGEATTAENAAVRFDSASPAQASAAQSDAEQARAAVPEGWQIVPKDRSIAQGMFDHMVMAVRKAMTDPRYNEAGDITAAKQWNGNTTNLVREIIAAATRHEMKWPLAASPTVPAQPVAAAADAGGMEQRAVGRAEAMQIIMNLSAEDGLDECIGSQQTGCDGEWDAYWKEDKLRGLLRVDDAAWSLVQDREDRLNNMRFEQAMKAMDDAFSEDAAPATSTAAQPVAKVGESADAKDAARLDFMAHHEAWIAHGRDGESCRVFHRNDEGDAVPMLGWGARHWRHDVREAIDAAMQSTTTGATDGAVGGEHVE